MSIRNHLSRSAFTFTALATFLLAACDKKDSPASTSAAPGASAAPVAADSQVHDATHPLEIAVTDDGFVPAHAKVKKGEPVKIFVTRKVERTCATDIVIKDYGINKPLPQGERVELTLTPQKAGPIRFACAMDMVSGELVAE
ncbi:MAG TPA: cupredoxin domain-containing protein [Polyangiaceae bacterium]|jgi:hypothetical protein|nr:cupredoxin domain-containing protein [Polyangiaceae bacterium]